MSAPRSMHFGISTCPNDTFAFHALMEGKVDPCGLDFRIELMDVQELNERLAAGDFDAAKASYHAALRLSDDVGVLPVGSALGFGVGPLLLSAKEGDHPSLRREDGSAPVVLCPGVWTTASLLFRLFHASSPGGPDPRRREGAEIKQVVFDQIMPALKRGEADFGVCIHEGRFTYESEGLHRVEDLGERWEQATGAPLPLGGLLARLSLGDEVHQALAKAIGASIDYAWEHREETLRTMKKHAQELDDQVIWRHVELYVNEWTRDLGEVGRGALDALRRCAVEAGIVGGDSAALRVLSGRGRRA